MLAYPHFSVLYGSVCRRLGPPYRGWCLEEKLDRRIPKQRGRVRSESSRRKVCGDVGVHAGGDFRYETHKASTSPPEPPPEVLGQASSRRIRLVAAHRTSKPSSECVLKVASRWASRVQSSREAVVRCREEAALQSRPASHWGCWHNAPLNSGGQMHFWPWLHVPPFWHRSISSSQTLAVSRENGRKREGEEEGKRRVEMGRNRRGERERGRSLE
ncbi:hypothetical protein EYF80_038216 [Liparis tanakae]|uniref:Uncharacterized protein n=1 Tax=Liparis tanakae TaxID=230148 RepID=A0A4Z2GDD2_9TELE|nr:hypothetical protein EYF80_038216 [Liparis tanakae]